ncbi:MAG: fatty acid desaturase [Candidatus Sericytochromatia bacterium]
MRYKIDLIPLAVVTGCFGLSLATLFVALPVPVLVGIFLLAVFLRNPTLCAQHNHSHLSMFRQAPLNFFYDLLLAQTTGYGTPEWELQHNRGHHSHYLDPHQDIAGSVDRDGSTMNLIYYIWQGYWRIFPDARTIALREHELGHPRMLRRLWLHTGVQLVLTGLWLSLNPLMALIYFVLPNLVIGRMMVWWGSYWHHFEVPRNDVYDGCRTEPGRIFNLISFNSGYHTAHHEKPALHWSLLPARDDAIRERIPAGCLVQDMARTGV